MTLDLSEQEVLRRGLDTFAELGYDGASVRELGRRIGVSHNFINDRYGSKLGFWRAVVDFAIAELDELPPTDDDFAGEVRHLYRTAARRPQLYRLIWDEATRESERLDYLCETYVRPAVEQTLPGARAALRERGLDELPVHVLYFVLTGALTGIVQSPLARRLGADADADLFRLADTLSGLVLSGLTDAAGR